MAGLTLDQAEAKLNEWLAVDTELQSGQSVRFGERLLTHADAIEVRNNIQFWDNKVKELAALTTGRGRSRTVTPRW
jgi:hypothetical protein